MNNFDLDIPLIEFANKKQGSSNWTIREAVEGIQIFGGIGSGKTSGSGRMVALKYLAQGFGGLVLTVKPDEKDLWQDYCRLTGRSNDLIVIEPGGRQSFNFLDYESSQSGSYRSLTDNLVQVLKTVIRASEEKSGGKSDDPFWETSLDMLMFNVIDLCQLAYGKVSIQRMYDIVLTAPKKDNEQQKVSKKEEEKKQKEKEQEDKNAQPEAVEKTAFIKAFEAAQQKIVSRIDAWHAKLSPETIEIFDADDVFEEKLFEAVPEARTLKFVDQFFIESYRNLSDKTRSIIEFMFSGFLFRLLKEPIYSLFCHRRSTVTPDDCWQGKIILLHFPVKIYQKVGRDIQIMFKYIWQRAMEKRQIGWNNRPVFLWADEAQNFLHEYDSEYQATARSSRIATVYISQNLPNYFANMGGAKSEYRVKSFLGTLGTKIFHANADIETNKYASELIGEGYEQDETKSTTVAGTFSSSRSTSYKLERMVRPEAFVSLRTGGPTNDLKVDGYMHRQSKPFQDGMHYRHITFYQDYRT